MSEIERGMRNAFICNVHVPMHWEREYGPRVLLAAGQDPDIIDTAGGFRIFSFSFNNKKDRKAAVKEIGLAIEGLAGQASIRMYEP